MLKYSAMAIDLDNFLLQVIFLFKIINHRCLRFICWLPATSDVLQHFKTGLVVTKLLVDIGTKLMKGLAVRHDLGLANYAPVAFLYKVAN
jgi:hypothetical protein